MPAADILEAGGNNSYENVAEAAPQLIARHATTVLVTTDPFHEDRSMAISSSLGLMPSPTPTRTSPITGWSTVPYFFKEAVGVGSGPDRRVSTTWNGFTTPDAARLADPPRSTLATPDGSANLIVHPFGGGVIGNTTGSGPVIEGSSPSPRAPAESSGKPPLGPIV